MILETRLQKEKADFIIEEGLQLKRLNKTQIQDIAILWSYYSGKIEGSTFTLVQTETLIKDDIVQGIYSDALMLKNMYNTLIQKMDYIINKGKEVINDRLILKLHSNLTMGLIDDEDRGKIKGVVGKKISGSSYVPSDDTLVLKKEINTLLSEIKKYDCIEKAVYLHCNFAKIQPFVDGNKRTARMLENIVLMNNNLLPTVSYDNIDILKYREAILDFYETNDYSAYTNFMLDSQINLIEKNTKPIK